MDQENQSQGQTQKGNPNGVTEALTTTPATASDRVSPAGDSATGQHASPVRPRRPQRSARVESSVDISEPKAEAPVDNEDKCSPDGAAASHPKPSRPAAGKPLGDHTGPNIKAGPKGAGHHPVRAASVPHPPVSRSVPPHLNPHAQRALSVAGTADTQAQTVEDFRQVCWSVCVSTHLRVHPQGLSFSDSWERLALACIVFIYINIAALQSCIILYIIYAYII